MNTPPRTKEFRFVATQALSAFAIALGTGLLVAGNSVDPVVRPDDIATALSSAHWFGRYSEFYFELAAGLKGVGAGVLLLGILGLLIPWVNALILRRRTTDIGPVKPPDAA